MKPPSLRTTLRQAHIKEDTRCIYCGAAERLTIDHIIRKTWARGFNPNIPDNIQVLCVICHGKKYAIEEKVQDWVMLGKFTREEAWEYVRNWSPGTRTTAVHLSQIPISKYLWQKERTFVIHVMGRTFGLKLFAKRRNPGAR